MVGSDVYLIDRCSNVLKLSQGKLNILFFGVNIQRSVCVARPSRGCRPWVSIRQPNLRARGYFTSLFSSNCSARHEITSKLVN